MRALVLAAFCFIALTSAVRADGCSVGFEEDAVPLLKKTPGLLEFIHKTLDIEDVGWATNGGHPFGDNQEGGALLPYGFRAKPKGQAGPYTVLVIIEKDEAHHGVVLTIAAVSPTGAIEGAIPNQ